jgi:hypothetical protein
MVTLKKSLLNAFLVLFFSEKILTLTAILYKVSLPTFAS